MSAFSGTGPRDGPGGGRKGGSAQLAKMHQPVPKGHPGGSSIRMALSHVNREAAVAAVQNRRWIGVVDDAPKRPVIAAWNPGGRAHVGNPAAGKNNDAHVEVARGPHLGFKKDYHRQHVDKQDAANHNDRFAADHYVKSQKVGVRPFRGVDGLRPDHVPVWETKQPQKPGKSTHDFLFFQIF